VSVFFVRVGSFILVEALPSQRLAIWFGCLHPTSILPDHLASINYSPRNAHIIFREIRVFAKLEGCFIKLWLALVHLLLLNLSPLQPGLVWSKEDGLILLFECCHGIVALTPVTVYVSVGHLVVINKLKTPQ